MNNQKQYTHVCIALNVYSLLQYLLLNDEEIIAEKTRYFIGSGVPKSIADRLNNAVYFDVSPKKGVAMIKRRLQKLRLALFANRLYPEIKNAEIFAQDHQYIPACLIGKKSYYLLSDSNNFFENQMNPGKPEWERIQRLQHSLKGKIESFIYGPLSIFQFGTSRQCKKIFVTKEQKSLIFNTIPHEVQSLKEMWNASSESKREIICTCFGLEKQDVDAFSDVQVLILTQCFVTDTALTEKENYELFKKIIDDYKGSKVMIKVHPREKFDFRSAFPECVVFDKPVPMELISLMGANISTAVTFFSSSINCLDDNVKKVRLGTAIHPKLLNFFGKL